MKLSEIRVSKKCLQLVAGTLHTISRKGAVFNAVVVRERCAGEKFGMKNGKETGG